MAITGNEHESRRKVFVLYKEISNVCNCYSVSLIPLTAMRLNLVLRSLFYHIMVAKPRIAL